MMVYAVTAVVCTALVCLSLDRLGSEIASSLRAIISILNEIRTILKQQQDITNTRRLYHD